MLIITQAHQIHLLHNQHLRTASSKRG
uniref:Uncharacterized protein n=1 Tax=Megaselia scalaris TaxID=36166 RepID=T1GKJ5_MEGSC